MVGLKETTKWEKADCRIPNHTYFLDEEGKLVAYIKAGSGELVKFKKPLKQFSKARRTFKEVKTDLAVNHDFDFYYCLDV
jgi:hypothetical protein